MPMLTIFIYNSESPYDYLSDESVYCSSDWMANSLDCDKTDSYEGLPSCLMTA